MTTVEDGFHLHHDMEVEQYENRRRQPAIVSTLVLSLTSKYKIFLSPQHPDLFQKFRTRAESIYN